MDSEVNPKPARIQALAQILAVSVKNLLLLAFGLSLAYPTIVIAGVTDPQEVFDFDKNGISWIGSLSLTCVPLGCIISGTLSEKFGRRFAMQIINVPFVVAWLLFYFSYEKWHVYAALAITGFTGGSLEAPVLTYVSEVCQSSLRGTLASVSILVCYCGSTLMVLLGMFVNWRIIALIAIVFHAISFVALFFIPETPHYLIRKARTEEAKESLAWLRGWTSTKAIEAEYQEIYHDLTKNKNARNMVFFVKQLAQKDFIWPFAVVMFVFFISHFCGSSTLGAFSIPILNTLRTPMPALDANGVLGIMGILGSIVNSVLIYKCGKRVLVFASLIGCAVCFYAIGAYAHTYDIVDIVFQPPNSTTEEPTWLPLTFLFIFKFIVHVGISTVPWILASEVFNSEIRATAAGMCSATTCIINFVCNKTYFDTITEITFAGVFFMYATISLVGCVVIYFILPETEGKSLIEINDHFAGNGIVAKQKDEQLSYVRTNQGFCDDVPANGYHNGSKANSYNLNKY